jgi:hypothetical protein
MTALQLAIHEQEKVIRLLHEVDGLCDFNKVIEQALDALEVAKFVQKVLERMEAAA